MNNLTKELLYSLQVMVGTYESIEYPVTGKMKEKIDRAKEVIEKAKYINYNKDSSKDKQVGGNHYQSLTIQPIDYIMKNDLDYLQACIVKYVTRFRAKHGIEDLQKAKHCIELLMEHEGYNNQEKDKQNGD